MGRKSNRKKHRASVQTSPASTALQIVAYCCLAIGIASFWGIAQFSCIDNTRNGVGFFFLFGCIGALISLPCYLLIYKMVPDFKNGQKISKQWTSNLFGLGMGLFFLTPAFAAYINRTYAAGAKQCKEYSIIRKSNAGGRYHEYYFFVVIDKEEERLTVYKDYWNKLAAGQHIELCLQKGILGFEYISIQQ